MTMDFSIQGIVSMGMLSFPPWTKAAVTRRKARTRETTMTVKTRVGPLPTPTTRSSSGNSMMRKTAESETKRKMARLDSLPTLTLCKDCSSELDHLGVLLDCAFWIEPHPFKSSQGGCGSSEDNLSHESYELIEKVVPVSGTPQPAVTQV